MPENNFPELPEFSELKDIKLPEPTVKETVYETIPHPAALPSPPEFLSPIRPLLRPSAMAFEKEALRYD